MLSINFTKREKGENKAGLLKAVYYSSKEKTTPIFVNAIDFKKLFRQTGESTVFELEGEGKKLQAMVQDVAYDPVKNDPIHIDFYIVEKGAKIDAYIPLEFVGQGEAIKSLGGTLVKVMHEIHVEAEATNLPHTIEIDLSSLENLDSVIHIKDVKLPAGVKLYHTDEDEIIASVAVQEEEDLSAPVESDISKIENSVEKGKKEETEE